MFENFVKYNFEGRITSNCISSFLEFSVMVTLRASLQEPLYSHTETAELPDGGEPRLDISSQRNGILRTKIFWFLENSPLT